MLGVLVIDKPAGISSHDVVNAVRRSLGVRRVGHSGTLDPLATGVLVIAVGPATRFLQYLPLEPKVYECLAKFGASTTTQDREGTVVRECVVPLDLKSVVGNAVSEFIGEVKQVPPMFSAIKLDGKPLYDYARRGESMEVESRTVYVHRFEPGECVGDEVAFTIECSGGTYVRTLLHDLGDRIGCGAHMTQLRRTRVGEFDLSDAITVEAIRSDKLISLREALGGIGVLQLGARSESAFRNGMTVPVESPIESGRIAILDALDRVFAIGVINSGQLSPVCVIPSEALESCV